MSAAKRICARVQDATGWGYAESMNVARQLAFSADPLAARQAGWVARASAMRREGVCRSFCAAVAGAGDRTFAASPANNGRRVA